MREGLAANRFHPIVQSPDITLRSVSYTHLDVYKRQVRGHQQEER